MRLDVDATLATRAHEAALDLAIREHEATAQRALDRIIRRYVRQAVASFTRGHLTVLAAANEYELPSWRMPLSVDLLDEAAMEQELEARAKKYADGVATTTSRSVASGLGIDFDQSNRLLRGVIAGQSGTRIVTAPRDLVGTLMTSLQKSYDAGDSIPKAGRAMRKAGYTHSKAYAERIARTELIGAVNAASLAQVQGATTIPYKLWMATNDQRTRPTHRNADGQTVPIDAAFSVGSARLEYPGDSRGPGEEVILCRCTMGYTDEARPGAGKPLGQQRGTIAQAAVPAPSTWARPHADESIDPNDRRPWNAEQQAMSDRYGMMESGKLDADIDEPWFGPDERYELERETARLRAWKRYSGSGHHDMNRVMRGRHPEFFTGGLDEITQANADLADLFTTSAFELEKDTLLYRGMLLKDPDNAPGVEIDDPAFMSASLSRDTGRYFVPSRADGDLTPVLMRLHAPQGTKAIPGTSGEQEWVLPPGSRYVVIREAPKDKRGFRVFDAIILLPGQTARGLLASMGGA